MAKKSKLLSALDSYKGRDYEKEHQKKLVKAAEKRQAKKKHALEDQDLPDMEDGNNVTNGKVEVVEDGNREAGEKGDSDADDDNEDKEGEEEEEEEEEDIPLSDLSGDERTDIITHQRLTINNSAAINASIKRISVIKSTTPFSEHNSLISSEPLDIPDPNDDLTRELAFYKVCQSAVIDGRRQLIREGIPFSRPTDYFAEMVKTDEQMGLVKRKLYEEAASKKAAAEARRQRDLKKFGKQVQIAKLQQRQKEKRETLEKINSLKRKRKADLSATTEDDGLFDVAIEDASRSESKAGRSHEKPHGSGGGSSFKRQKKNEKYGFGGKKRFAKSGDAISSGDMRKFSVTKMKTGGGRKGGGSSSSKRPGKSRRKTTR